MSEQNKALVRRFYEAYSAGNADALDDLVAPNFINHNPGPEEQPGLPGLKQRINNAHNAIDNTFTIEDLLAEGDQVVVRYTMRGTHKGEALGGYAPTGKSYAVQGIGIYTVAGGKLTERWVTTDGLGILRQTGALPAQR
jgi:predicted ester cyclase